MAVDLAKKAGTSVVLDLDFRPDQWKDPRAYGVAVGSVLHCVNIILGTEDEINAARLTDPHAFRRTYSQVTDARIAGSTAEHVRDVMEYGPGWWRNVANRVAGFIGVRTLQMMCRVFQ